MRILWLVILLALPLTGQPVPAQLREIREVLRPVCAAAEKNQSLTWEPDEKPLWKAKQLLATWLDQQVRSLPSSALPRDLERRTALWNQAIQKAGLDCRSKNENNDKLGSVLGVRLLAQRSSLFALATTFGRNYCNVDESLYLYRIEPTGPKRILVEEYDPQKESGDYIKRWDYFQVSETGSRPQGNENKRLILALGVPTNCTSAWSSLHTRLWQLDEQKGTIQALVRLDEGGRRDHVGASLSGDSALIEYGMGALDIENLLLRPEPKQWLVKDGKANRTDPYALSPIQFVDYWLHTLPDSKRPKRVNYGSESWRCSEPADAYMVKTIQGENAPAEEGEVIYYQVRWRPPYRFSMISQSGEPFPGCNIPDPGAEDRHRTLFPQ